MGTVANSVLDIASDVKDVEDERNQLALDNAAIRAELATASTALTIAESLLTGNAEEIARLNVRITELEALLAGGEDPDPEPTDPEGWTLHYATNFANLDGWTVKNGQTQSNDNSANMSANCVPGPNGLDIWGKRQASNGKPYTSGEIENHGAGVVPNYFRAEVVGTAMDDRGLWPCLLWFRPQAGGDGSNGEIDLMEIMNGNFTGNQRRVAVTMHNEYGSSQDSWKGPIFWQDLTNIDPTAEHKYTLEKTPGQIKVWMDDDEGKAVYFGTTTEVRSHLPQNGVTSPKIWWARIMEASNRTWYPRITLQIGAGSSVQVVPEPESTWQQSKMTVRSLKLWVPA